MMTHVNLYAFPYAFGNSNIYQELSKYTGKYIKVKPLNYPGHGSRMSDKFANSIQEMASDAYDMIENELDNEYCLLGYSMGGQVCYELYQLIKKNNRKLPIHMFIFASDAPDFKQDIDYKENMTLQHIKKILIDMNGTPNEILKNDEFIEMIAPIVESDSSNIKNYIPTNYAVEEIDCPVTIIRGLKEETETCESSWNKYFKNKCEYIIVNGGHFFMFENDNKQMHKVVNIINQRIQKHINMKG